MKSLPYEDPDHRQPPPLGVQRVPAAGQFLLLLQQPQPGLYPLPTRHDLGQRHHSLLTRDGSLTLTHTRTFAGHRTNRYHVSET